MGSSDKQQQYSPFKSFQGGRLTMHSKLPSFEGATSWSKREADWYEIEDKAVFKNNVKNFTDGDASNVEAFIRVI